MEPGQSLLNRTLESELALTLAQFSKMIENAVDFGERIYKWDLGTPGGDERLTANLFLRNFIETLDAISILIKHSSADPCGPLIRVALETFLQLEYLLDKDHEQRALSFIIWNSKEQQKVIEKCDGKSDRYMDLARKFKNDKLLQNSEPPVLPDTDTLKQRVKELQNLPKYAGVMTEWVRTTQTNRNPYWYSLYNGPRNLEELSKVVKLEAQYEVLYRSWSKSSHGQDILQGKVSADKKDSSALIDAIRNPKNAQQITQYCVSFSILLYRSYVMGRIPDKKLQLDEWYNSIRHAYLQLTTNTFIQMKD